jgi:hypothetical protein
MNYAVKMGSGAMIHTQTFIKAGSAIQKKVNRGIHRHIDSMLNA